MSDRPTLDALINEYPRDMRDDLSSLATRLEFQLGNFCRVIEKPCDQHYLTTLRELLITILNAPE